MGQAFISWARALAVLGLVLSTVAGAPVLVAAETEAVDVRIKWRSWNRESFEMAAGMRRPVMLYLRAADCRLCLVMEETVLADESVVRNVADRVVPVLVDADLRPDLAARYVVGTVPTVVFLLPNGEPLYEVDDASSLERVGGYFASAEGLNSYIGQVVKYFGVHRFDLVRKAREVGELERKLRDYAPGTAPVEELENVLARAREGLDFTHGGHGRAWKFIEDDPARLFRILASQSDQPALRRAVAATAAGMLSGTIHDQVDGGFHHFATTREWGVPALEKRLQENGRALRLLTAAAALAPADEAIEAGLRDTAHFLLSVLAREGGALAFSQRGSLGVDDQGSYFKADAAGRESLRPPPLVVRPLGEAMAMASLGLMEAGALLANEAMEQAGLAAVDYLAANLYAPSRGVARYLNSEGAPSQRGILADQVAAMEALIMAYQLRGSPGDLEKALDIHAFCRANLRQPAGFFVDRVMNAEAVGKMRRPLVPTHLNARLALASFRLAILAGDESLRAVGMEVLGALRSTIPHLSGAQAAAYAEALFAAADPAVRTVLAPAAGMPMRRAALLLPAAGGVVMPAGSGPEAEFTGAMVCAADQCVGPVTEAGALVAALGEARRLAASAAAADEGGEVTKGSEDDG